MKILYAEDEKELSMAIVEILKIDSYEVDAVYDGEEAWEHLQKQEYDAVILDIMMPKMDGITVLQHMRAQEDYTPVLLLTAKAETEDRISGLSVGADDYLGKPFSAGELLARVGAMIRRSQRYKPQLQTIGNITLNCETHELKSDIGGFRLSSKEAQLLSLLIRRKSIPLSLEQLREQIWKNEKGEDVVMLYLSYLKNKLTQIHATVNVVRTDAGFFLGAQEDI